MDYIPLNKPIGRESKKSRAENLYPTFFARYGSRKESRRVVCVNPLLSCVNAVNKKINNVVSVVGNRA